MSRTITQFHTKSLRYGLCMVNKITYTFIYKGCMVVIAAYIKPYRWIGEDFSCISKWSHWIITYHIANISQSWIAVSMRPDKVGAVRIVVFTIVFKYTAVLKHTRRVNLFCLSLNTNHICAQFGNSCGFRIELFSICSIIGHAAAKIDISAAVIIYQHCRIKAPSYTCTPRRLSGKQCLADGILPGT